MWRRHGPPAIPTHRALRATCMALLPLVEMYCKWELEEDCSDLTALMHRFDDESVLETHELGRSLLLMLRDEDIGLQILPPPSHFALAANPFDAIRSRLQAVDNAFHALRPQVHLVLLCCRQFYGCFVDVVPLGSVFLAASYVFVQEEFNGKFSLAVLPSLVHVRAINIASSGIQYFVFFSLQAFVHLFGLRPACSRVFSLVGISLPPHCRYIAHVVVHCLCVCEGNKILRSHCPD